MMNHIKNYVIGLIAIFVMFHPVLLMKWLGAVMGHPLGYLSAWIVGLCLEAVVAVLLYVPYEVGTLARAVYNEVLTEPPSTVKNKVPSSLDTM